MEPEPAKALLKLAKSLDKLTEEVTALRFALRAQGEVLDRAAARLDVLTLRIAAFERHGAVLFLQRDSDALLAPAARPPEDICPDCECDRCGGKLTRSTAP